MEKAHDTGSLLNISSRMKEKADLITGETVQE